MLLKKIIKYALPKIRVSQKLTVFKTCYHSSSILSSNVIQKSDYSDEFSKSQVVLESVKKSIEHLYCISECIEDDSLVKCRQLFDSIMKNIEALDDDDLHKLLDSLKIIKNNLKIPKCEKEELFGGLCAAIDKKCHDNFPNWTLAQSADIMLKFSDIDTTRRYKESFIYRLTTKFTGKGLYRRDIHLIKKFLIIAHKCNLWKNPYIKMYDVVQKLEEEIDNLSLKDTVPFAIAYYNKERILRGQIVKKWYEKFLKEMDALSHDEFTHILKLFSTYSSPSGAPYAYDVLTKLIDKIDQVDGYCYSFAASLTSHYSVYHSDFLNKLLLKYAQDIENLNFNCVERILYAFSYFNFRTNELSPYQLTIDEFEKESRQSVIMDHTKSYSRIVKHLTFAGIYHAPFINQVLSQEFLKKSFKRINKYSIPPDILMIDQGVKIECPNYDGNCLEENLTQSLIDKYAWRLDDPKDASRFYNKLLTDINNVLSDVLGGVEYTHMCYPLPHLLKHDIVFCLNENKPVKLPDIVKQSLTLKKNQIENTAGKWYCVTALHTNVFFNQPLRVFGSCIVKIRQLQSLGFTVVDVDSSKWWNEMSNDDKISYLKEKINL